MHFSNFFFVITAYNFFFNLTTYKIIHTCLWIRILNLCKVVNEKIYMFMAFFLVCHYFNYNCISGTKNKKNILSDPPGRFAESCGQLVLVICPGWHTALKDRCGHYISGKKKMFRTSTNVLVWFDSLVSVAALDHDLLFYFSVYIEWKLHHFGSFFFFFF